MLEIWRKTPHYSQDDAASTPSRVTTIFLIPYGIWLLILICWIHLTGVFGCRSASLNRCQSQCAKGIPLTLVLPGTLYHALFEIELFSKKKTSALLEKYHASYRRCLACIMVENTSYNLTTWNQRMCKVYFSSLNICYSSKVNLP